MAKVHLLNVKPGDCTVIQHASGRVTMMDICGGNADVLAARIELAVTEAVENPRGNFRMCKATTHPISYLEKIGVENVFRFILSHPDMDHMDGFDRLLKTVPVTNFWDSGSPRPKPEFGPGCGFLEADWDRFEKVRKGLNPGTSSSIRQAGASFAYGNKDGKGGAGDALTILAPTKGMIDDPDFADDVNEGSYVILYRSAGGKIILPGDAHDAAWEHIIANNRPALENCAFLLAPHHGRDSGRSYDFLSVARPKLTLIGCAPSKHIDYDQWHRRELDFITSNQAGNVVLHIFQGIIDVYIENEQFVSKSGLSTDQKDEYGNTFYRRIEG
jgi:competence protein ComEC